MAISVGLFITVAVVIGLIGLAMYRGMTKPFKGKTNATVGLVIVGLAVVAIAGQQFDFLDQIPLLKGIEFANQTAVPTTPGVIPGSTASLSGYAVENLAVTAKEANSNDRASVDGFLRIYESNVDPASATANPLDSVTVYNGVGSSTNKVVKMGVQYRMVFEGNSTGSNYYDVDLGTRTLDSFGSLNPNTGVLSVDVGEVKLVATIDDIIAEETAAANSPLNGQATMVNVTAGTGELQCADTGAACAADGTIVYDESVGDQSWYMEPTASVSGANAVSKQYVWQFKFDSTNPPEANEYTQITAQLLSGRDAGIPSDVTNFWKTETPITFGDLNAGTFSKYRLTFSEVEANEDANDDWTLNADDLGRSLGQDVRLNTRATADKFTYGGSTT